MGCRLWGRTEWDTTEATQQQQPQCIYVESRRMVPMDLSAEQQKGGRGEQTCGHRGKERVGRPGRASWKHKYYHMSDRQPVGVYCMQRTLKPVLCDNLGGWVGWEV